MLLVMIVINLINGGFTLEVPNDCILGRGRYVSTVLHFAVALYDPAGDAGAQETGELFAWKRGILTCSML